MPYISLLVPCLIIFRQHEGVFQIEGNQRHRTISSNNTLIYVEDVEEPDLRVEPEIPEKELDKIFVHLETVSQSDDGESDCVGKGFSNLNVSRSEVTRE